MLLLAFWIISGKKKKIRKKRESSVASILHLFLTWWCPLEGRWTIWFALTTQTSWQNSIWTCTRLAALPQWWSQPGSVIWDIWLRGLPGQGKRLMVMSVTPCLLGHEVAGKQARTDYSVPTALKGGASGGICFLAWCNRSCCTWEGSVWKEKDVSFLSWQLYQVHLGNAQVKLGSFFLQQ